MIRQNRWVREILAIGWPITFYWIGLILSLVVFASCVVVTQDTLDAKDFWVLTSIWMASIGGVLFGQLVSLTRLRSTIFQTGALFFFFIAIYVVMTHEDALQATLGETGFAALLMFSLLGSIMASGGFWSLRVNRGLMAYWGPTLLATGGILMVSEHFNTDDAWHAGDKYAIWSASTAGILLLSIFLQLVFMAARERHRIHRWRTAPRAAELVQNRPDPVRPFSGLGTWILFGLLVFVVTGTSGVVAPYLWRTGPGDRQAIEDPDVEGETESEAVSPPDMGGMEQMIRRAQQAISLLCTLLTMLVLAVLALLIFGPPTRRQLLLTHLRNPLWPVTTSHRAHLHWRLAEIAMGDAGVHRQPGETALEAAQRTVTLFPDVNLEALTTAAEISDRVAYGYTLDASDADTVRRAAEMTYQAVWDTLGELDRIRNTYRLI